MTVTTSLLATSTIRSIGDQSVKLSAVLNNRTSSIPTSASIAANSAQIDTKAAAQQPPLDLRVDTLSVGYVSTKTNTISDGTVAVSRLLDQLQSLATRASLGGLSESALELLNGQFQALRLSISNVPPAPPETVDVSSLLGKIPGGLDSSFGQEVVAQNLKIGGLNDDKALLGDANLLTTDAANQALSTIAGAQDKVGAHQDTISRLQDVIGFATASSDTAIQNHEALRSTLTEADLDATTPAASLQAALLAQSDTARAVQTKNLPNLLQLLS